MATITDRATVDKIIAGNGKYPGDSGRILRIVEYNNIFDGRVAYGLEDKHNLGVYTSNRAATVNPRVIWEYKK